MYFNNKDINNSKKKSSYFTFYVLFLKMWLIFIIAGIALKYINIFDDVIDSRSDVLIQNLSRS